MNYKIWMPLVVTSILILMSLIWNVYINNNIKNNKLKIVNIIEPILITCIGILACPILLGNSDENISDAIKYVKPTNHLDNIFGGIND